MGKRKYKIMKKLYFITLFFMPFIPLYFMFHVFTTFTMYFNLFIPWMLLFVIPYSIIYYLSYYMKFWIYIITVMSVVGMIFILTGKYPFESFLPFFLFNIIIPFFVVITIYSVGFGVYQTWLKKRFETRGA